jgi:hypothetical protein
VNLYIKHLKEVATEIFLLKNLRDCYLWSELYEHGKEFLWAIIYVAVGVLVLLTSPVSVPLLALICTYYAQKMEGKQKEFKIKVHKRFGGEE